MGEKVGFAPCGAGCTDISESLSRLRGCFVLGINPPVHDFAWFDLWSKPLGLLNLLSSLRDLGNEVHLVDCLYEGRADRLSFGRWRVKREILEKPAPYRNIPRRYYRFGIGGLLLRERLSGLPRPDVILVTSAMTYWYPGVFEAVKIAKETFPDVPVLLGGTYARLCPEHAMSSGADFVQTADLSLSAASPAFDLYCDLGYGVLVTSYGCPMQCDYCASRLLWGNFRQRSLDDILKDLCLQMSASRLTDMAFYDDALLLNKEQVFYPLCEYISKHFPALRLHTPNGLHVAQMDEKCCQTLYNTGFSTIRLSLEGIDSLTEEASSRKTNLDGYKNAVLYLEKAGYTSEQVETYILAGLPGQKYQDVASSIDFVKALGGRPKLAEFSPIPGTKLYNTALSKCPELAVEPLLHNNTIYAQYAAGDISPPEMQELKNMAKPIR